MHFLNPENRIYYVDMQKAIDAHGQAQAKTSRLLAEAAQKDYYAEALAKEVAALEGLDESRIIVRQETVWVGKEQSDGTYKIQTSAAAGSAQKPSSVPANLTEEERKLLAYDTVKKEVVQSSARSWDSPRTTAQSSRGTSASTTRGTPTST